MSQDRVPYNEFVRAEVDGLLLRARQLREIAEKWEREAKDLRRSAGTESGFGSVERSE